MAQLAVDRDEVLRADEIQQQLLLLLAGVARDVYRCNFFVDHVCAPLDEAIDRAVDHLLVAGDGVSRDDHRIAAHNFELPVPAGSHPRQGRRRFTLSAGGDDHRLLWRQTVHLLQANEHVRGYFQVSQLASHPHVLNHRPPGDGHPSFVAHGAVDHLLDARDQRGKGGDDDPPARSLKDLVKSGVNHPL